MRSRCLTLSLAIAAAALAGPSSLPAQGHLVVPPDATAAEANGAEAWALGPFAARRQLLLEGAWLDAAQGRSFTGLAVRRNQGTPQAQRGGRLRIDVILSHAPVDPPNASGSFATNRGSDAQQVFSGLVELPDAPLAPTTPAPWQAPYAVTIPFTVPFAYRGGTLAIETITRTVQGTQNPWWPIDAAIADATGAVRTVGRSCVVGVDPSAGAEIGSVAVGATAVFWLRGRLPFGPAMCLIGGSDTRWQGMPLPLDLTAAGAPGCLLYNDVLAAVPSMLGPMHPPDALATVEIDVPPHASLAGVRLFAQWLLPDAANRRAPFTASNGVAVDVGAMPTWPGAAWIEAVGNGAGRGRILHDRCPVLRLDYWP